MRFLTRSLTGLVLLALTLGLLGLAVGTLRQAAVERETTAGGRPPPAERVYGVSVATLNRESASPVLTAYGDLQSARELELRAATSGTLVDLAPGFRDGGRVTAGEVLYRIDPAAAETALALAESDLAAARAEQAEAAVGLELAREDVTGAERQLALRRLALDRAEDLSGRGVGTAADLETAQLALATAEQELTGRRLARAQASARIDRAAIARDRAEIARDEAARDLENTVETAPFDGLMTEVTAVPGRLVSENEQLGRLIDPGALEVAFRVSNAEYARLADASGAIRPLEITASLGIDGIELAAAGRIDRAGASVGAGQTGRLIYARLDADRPGLFRPGDFLTVRVAEPTLEDVAVVAATAVSPEGRILLVAEDTRLEEVAVTVVRRQGDAVILSEAPFGETYVTERLPQIGPGVRVRPIVPGGAAPSEALEAAAEEMVRLSPERRAGLIAAVEAQQGLGEEDRARILAALEAEEVPQQMIDRLEDRRSGG